MESKKTLPEILQKLQTPIVIINEKWKSLSFNLAFKKYFNISDDINNLNIKELIKSNIELKKITSSKIFNIQNDNYKNLLKDYSVNVIKLDFNFFLIEILDNKKSELAIFQSMMMDLPGNIYWLSADNKFQGCNKQQAIAAGLNSPDQIIGKTNGDMRWKDQAEELDKINIEVMQSKKTISKVETAKMYDENGELKKRTYQSNKIPILNSSNDSIGILGVSVDITDLKEAQEKADKALAFAAEAERRRKQFLSNQEHDINTALTGIIYGGTMFQMTDGTEDPAYFKLASEKIIKSAQCLQKYNRSLLKDLSWLDNEGQLIERRADIRLTLQKLFDINCLAAESKGSKLIFDEIDEAIPQYLMVDDIALFQCLQDLIGNAINFTLKGTITLSVKRAKTCGDTPVIAFHVKDTGRGIEEVHQRYIFEDYYKVLPSNQPDQVTGEQADEDKGRGLGLALSSKKAQAMGGELHLEWSKVGVGSEFVLTVALKPALNQGK